MWAFESVFYQIYPLGFCGAPFENDGVLNHRRQRPGARNRKASSSTSRMTWKKYGKRLRKSPLAIKKTLRQNFCRRVFFGSGRYALAVVVEAVPCFSASTIRCAVA